MKQTTLFDLEAFTQSPLPTYDPAWDKTDTCDKNIDTVLEQTQHSPKADYNVLEQATTDTNKSAPEHTHWVEKYTVVRYSKEHYYYRYLWMSKRKLHHVHIPGGNVRSSLAHSRKLSVETAISDGHSPQQIQQLIRSWSLQQSQKQPAGETAVTHPSAD